MIRVISFFYFLFFLSTSPCGAASRKELRNLDKANYWLMVSGLGTAIQRVDQSESCASAATVIQSIAASSQLIKDRFSPSSQVYFEKLFNEPHLVASSRVDECLLKMKSLLTMTLSEIQPPPIPIQTPDVTEGKKLFGQHCESCHGSSGDSDGALTALLKVKPSSLMRQPHRVGLSPLLIFASLVADSNWSEMPKFSFLDQDQLWNIAFFVASLPYKSGQSEPVQECQNVDIDLQTITYSDDLELSLIGKNHNCSNLVKSVRLFPERLNHFTRVNESSDTNARQRFYNAGAWLGFVFMFVAAFFYFFLRRGARVK